MTVSNTNDRQYYTGDGANVNFPFTFPFFSNDEIYVWLVAADGTLTAQTETTNYTLSGAGSPTPGGQVTMIVAPPLTYQLLVQRILPFIQDTSIRNQEDFYPEVHEDVFDKLVMLLQQVNNSQAGALSSLSRALRVALTDPAIPVLPNVASRQGKYLSFDSSGNPVAVTPAVGSVDALVATLISTGGAAFIGSTGGISVQAALNNRITAATIGSAAGASIVGTSRGSTVEAELTTLLAQPITNAKSVATIAALRALSPTGISLAMTSGYYAAADTGGGSLYVPVASDTTSADNGGSIIVGVGGMRWYLLHDGTVRVEQFGAVPDGSTNCTPNVTAAAASGIRDIVFGTGPYKLVGNIPVPTRVTLRGIKGGGTDITWVGAGSFILNSYTCISGFRFDCSAMTAGTWLFLLNTATASMEYVTVEDIYTFSATGIMTDGNHATNVATNIRVHNLSCRLMKGPGFLLRDVFAFLEMRDIAVDYVGNAVAQNYAAFTINFNQGCLLDNCEVSGGQIGSVAGVTAAQIGFSFTSSQAIYMIRCFADSLGGKGMAFSSCQYVRMILCTSSLNDDTGVYLTSCTDAQISNLYAQGRKGVGTPTAGIPAVLLNLCGACNINGIESINATGDCLSMISSSLVQVNGGNLRGSTGRGLVTTGAGSLTLTTGVLFASNAAGNYSLVAAADILNGCQNNGGTLVSVIGPGAA